MFEQLTQFNDLGMLILRLGVAIIFIYHSLPKLKNAKAMAGMVGMSTGMVWFLGLVELVSAVGLIIGFYTQLAALLLGLVMLGAIWLKLTKWHVPFSAMDKSGWEFDLILLAAATAILLNGGGSIGIQ